jgi:type III pantothenate kinase
MILAIDAGNSRVKWGLHDGRGWLSQGWADNGEMRVLGKAWRGMATPGRVVISNVAGAGMREALGALLSHWIVTPFWVTAEASACGVSNGYDNPAQLGSDRWAALVAAWGMRRAGCLVVNAGTALTADVLSDEGVFLGGVIVPGLVLMQQSLGAGTALGAQPCGRFTPLPGNTADAVYSGALQALAGAVESMWRELARVRPRDPHCVLSGGTAQQLAPLLAMPVTAVENLVLEGLVRIAREAEPL